MSKLHMIEHRGIAVPAFFYGTAWKEDSTEELTTLALESGFLAIDTANQRKHYHETGVGNALLKYLQSGGKRQDLFLQTKFTYLRGQDHRLPYDPQASYPVQVQQSFDSSLQHLNTDYVDSYVLHGPSTAYDLSDDDYTVWQSMETIYKNGKARFLGVSNVNLEQLKLFLQHSEITPAFVQNRCYARTGWDKNIRQFCQEHQILYQGFSLLTANIAEIQSQTVIEIARKYEKTLPQIIFRFAMQSGMIPLTGTSKKANMIEDLHIHDFELNRQELLSIENIAI